LRITHTTILSFRGVQYEEAQDRDWENIIALDGLVVPNVRNTADQFHHSAEGNSKQLERRNPPEIINVYERRKKSGNIPEEGEPGETVRPESEVLPSTETHDHQGETETVETAVEEAEPADDDLEWPIALRKGVRECTRHPIQRYVHYG